jgi:hypothetical protein
MAEEPGVTGPLATFAAPARAAVDEPPATVRANSPISYPEVEPPESWHLLRRLVAGPYRRMSPKHLSAYWNELLWRDANRENPDAFRAIVVALLAHPPVPYASLTGRGRAAAWSAS